MKICFIGGHLSPALAVIDALPKQWEVCFIGRKHTFEGDSALSLEYETITKRDIPFYDLKTGRVQRKLSFHTIPSLLKVPKGFFQSITLLKKEKPDFIMGFGGYLSLPVCLAGYILKIPIIIHEQTLEVGLANKLIGKIADKVCISWKFSEQFFPKKKTILTGNPLRIEIIHVKKTKREVVSPPALFITGGSSGSQAINKAIEDILPGVLDTCQIIHQTGGAKDFADYHRLQGKSATFSQEQQERYTLMPFLSPGVMAQNLYNADLVISRSGMNTTTELLYLEKPSLLIPLPHGQKGEQLNNAQFLKKHGLAEVLMQDTLSAKLLLEKINMMLSKEYVLSDHSLSTIHEKAAGNIIKVIQDVAKKKKITIT